MSTDDELRQWIENEESTLLKDIGINSTVRPSPPLSLKNYRHSSIYPENDNKNWKLSREASLKVQRDIAASKSAVRSTQNRLSIDSIEPDLVQHAPTKRYSRDGDDVVKCPEPTKNQQDDLELLPGSVYLVDSDGSILKLPIPSDDPKDPLQWGRWKRAGALFCIIFFQVLSLSICQFPEVNFRLLQADPAFAVSDHPHNLSFWKWRREDGACI